MSENRLLANTSTSIAINFIPDPISIAFKNLMNPIQIIEDHADRLRDLGANRVGIFGSFARGKVR